MHEMVHLLVRKHDEQFVANMDRLLPHWRLLCDEPHRGALAPETGDAGLAGPGCWPGEMNPSVRMLAGACHGSPMGVL